MDVKNFEKYLTLLFYERKTVFKKLKLKINFPT